MKISLFQPSTLSLTMHTTKQTTKRTTMPTTKHLNRQSLMIRTAVKACALVLLSIVVSSCAVVGNVLNTQETVVINSDTGEQNTVVYLSRHAEKQDTKIKDPELSAKGEKTAKRLANYLKNINLDMIYSTPYKRTRNTATAVASQQEKLVTELFLPAHEMARLIREMHTGQNILVVGHSNTTPALINQLGVNDKIEIAEDEYGELFIVTINKGGIVSFKRVMY